MKIAPEHSEPEILRLMHKNDALELDDFLQEARKIALKAKVKVDFTPYLISSHPGCGVAEMRNLARSIKRNALQARQYQDFTPTPGTLSTAMYVSGRDRDTLKPIRVAKGATERQRQRQELEKISGRRKSRPQDRTNSCKPGCTKCRPRTGKRRKTAP
jgi:radical SAM superfamily enzyme YgiQ (UPF0313 family)